MLNVTPTKLRQLLMDTAGVSFTVVFTKRTTGETRVMTAVTDYERLLKGGEAKYDAISKGLLIVRDLDKDAIRSIPLDGIKHVLISGTQYFVVPDTCSCNAGGWYGDTYDVWYCARGNNCEGVMN
jgi:hypothetical protein